MCKEAYETEKRTLNYTACAKDLVQLKRDHSFLKEVDSIALQQSLRHLDTAFQNFFRRKEFGYPRFKSKKNHHHSYSTMCVNHNIRLEGKKLLLSKLKWIRIKAHRQIPEQFQLKSVTVSRTPTGKYFSSLQYEYEAETVPEKRAFVASDKEIYTEEEHLRHYRKTQDSLAKAQRRLSHCQKGSRRYQKQRRRVALLHERTANQRKDYLHKKSRQIINAFDAVCIENLDMKGIAGGLYFGKSVYDNGWGCSAAFWSIS